MARFSILTGEKYTVQADSDDQAVEKLSAHILGKECPCGESSCNCIEYNEIDTWVVGEEN